MKKKNTEAGMPHDPLYRALGARLRGIREARGLMQKDVAEHLDMHASTICYLETGTHRIQLSDLVKWCELLGVNPGVVLNEAYALVPEQRTYVR